MMLIMMMIMKMSMMMIMKTFLCRPNGLADASLRGNLNFWRGKWDDLCSGKALLCCKQVIIVIVIVVIVIVVINIIILLREGHLVDVLSFVHVKKLTPAPALLFHAVVSDHCHYGDEEVVDDDDGDGEEIYPPDVPFHAVVSAQLQ